MSPADPELLAAELRLDMQGWRPPGLGDALGGALASLRRRVRNE
jgi:hypothetical protein